MNVQTLPSANPGNTGAIVNQNGVLTCAVQQPVDSAVNISWDSGASYHEQWKGPYAEFKHVTSGSGKIFNAMWKVGAKRPTLDNRWHYLINPPEPLKGMSWVVDTIVVNETNPPGEHAILDITYKAWMDNMIPTYGGYGGRLSADDKDIRELSNMVLSSEATMNLDERIGWDLTWGTYSRNVLEYCTDPKSGHATEEMGNLADRVIRCAQFPKPTKKMLANSPLSSMISAQQYCWIEFDAMTELSSIEYLKKDKERQIYDLHCRGVQPVFHYPILQYTETYNWPANYPKKSIPLNAKGAIDYIANPATISSCPFELSGWQWLNVGVNMRCTDTPANGGRKVEYLYRWEGMLSADERFYGPDGATPYEGRWIPGQDAPFTPQS